MRAVIYLYYIRLQTDETVFLIQGMTGFFFSCISWRIGIVYYTWVLFSQFSINSIRRLHFALTNGDFNPSRMLLGRIQTHRSFLILDSCQMPPSLKWNVILNLVIFQCRCAHPLKKKHNLDLIGWLSWHNLDHSYILSNTLFVSSHTHMRFHNTLLKQ